MAKDYWNLKPGERARHGDEILTFKKVDGMYAVWSNEKGEPRIGMALKYELGEDGIYVPAEE